MSQQYDNTNRGALFKNDRKENKKHADYRGEINVDGQEFWLNAWIKEGKKGKFFSLSVKPKEPRGPQPHSKKSAPTQDDPGEIPF